MLCKLVIFNVFVRDCQFCGFIGDPPENFLRALTIREKRIRLLIDRWFFFSILFLSSGFSSLLLFQSYQVAVSLISFDPLISLFAVCCWLLI